MLFTIIGMAGLTSLASAQLTTLSTGTLLHNPLPSAFPVTTQTHFDSPACTGAAGSAIQKFTTNYNFEGLMGFPITALTPVGIYNLLNFSNINFVNTDPDFDGNHLGLAPHTYPNGAVFSTSNGLGPVTPLLVGAPVITAGYIESTIDSFTPHSFWYGCVADSPYTAGSVPAACNITATGFSKAGTKIASQTFAFLSNGSLIQDQAKGTFNAKFAGIYSLVFNAVQGGPVPKSALFDNLIVTLSQHACAPFYTGSYNNGT